NDRIGDTAGLTLNGGSFTYIGNAANSSETFGTLSLPSGNSTFTITPTGVGSAILSSAGLSRSAGATANFVAGAGTLGSGTNQLNFTTAPTLTNSILPYAIVGGTDFASYNQFGSVGLPALPSGNYT